MKIAFSTAGADLDATMEERFGRCTQFLVYDNETQETNIIPNATNQAAQGAGIKAAETVVTAGAKIVITGDCGPKAYDVLVGQNVRIFSAKNMSLREALTRYEADKLEEIRA